MILLANDPTTILLIHEVHKNNAHQGELVVHSAEKILDCFRQNGCEEVCATMCEMSTSTWKASRNEDVSPA